MPIIRDLVYGAASRGAAIEELCVEAGINRNDLNDSDKKLDFVQAYRVWEHAVKLTKDKALGLHLGEETNPTILGLVGHLMQSCRTLSDAFHSVAEFSYVATDMFRYEIEKKGSNYILTFTPATLWKKQSEESARHATEQAMAGTISVFYFLSGRKIYPTKACFSHRRVAALEEYERVFNSALEFNAKSNLLIFPATQLESQVVTHDRSLQKLFTIALHQKDKKKNLRFSDELKEVIMKDFAARVPSISILASHIGLGVRTLQRKLKEDSVSYRQLTSSIRREVAKELLQSPDIKMKYVSNVLGYSDARAFRRAYRKWQ